MASLKISESEHNWIAIIQFTREREYITNSLSRIPDTRCHDILISIKKRTSSPRRRLSSWTMRSVLDSITKRTHRSIRGWVYKIRKKLNVKMSNSANLRISASWNNHIITSCILRSRRGNSNRKRSLFRSPILPNTRARSWAERSTEIMTRHWWGVEKLPHPVFLSEKTNQIYIDRFIGRSALKVILELPPINVEWKPEVHL